MPRRSPAPRSPRGGLLLAGRGFRDLRENLTPLPHPKDGGRLVESGVYARVRHPIYGGAILLALGWVLHTAAPAAIAAALLILVFFDLKSRREEAWLEGRYAGYPAYRARTRRFLPWAW